MRRTIVFACIVALVLLQPAVVFGEAIRRGFNPNLLVPDSVFPDTKTLGGSAGIQKFLESKGSVLANTSREFLLKLREPDDAFLKENLGDPRHNLSRPRTAAELIWDAARGSGLNPQVILVTLNKEQGLITNNNRPPDKLQRALDHSMGFGCPDNQGCDEIFAGFYFQLFGNIDSEGNRYIGAAKSLMRSFDTTGGRGPTLNGKTARVGDTIVLKNTLGGYIGVSPEQTITVGNRATAALYRYTPHVFNGNYNFWKFFTSWFKYPNGTYLVDAESGILYLLQQGNRRQVPQFVAKARKLNIKSAVAASPTELANYPLGKLYGPINKTVVSLEGKTHVFIDGVRHAASPFVLRQMKLSTAKRVKISATEAALFAAGEQLLPADGTVVSTRGKKKIYLVQDGTLKLFSRFTLNQLKAKDSVRIIPKSELAGYPTVGYVAPRDGTLVRSKSSSEMYIMSEGKKRPLPPILFVNLGYKKIKVVRLSDAEIDYFPTGTFPVPREGTYFTVKETDEVYQFKKGATHKIAADVVKRRRIKPRFTFSAAMLKDWPAGKPITK